MAATQESAGTHMPGRLRGKTAIVTGAAHGIGRATAILFAREGARVLALDIDEDGGRETSRLLDETGSQSLFVNVDVSDAAGIERVVARASKELGPVTILVNCAGIMPEGTVLTTSETVWNHVLDVNLTSMFLLSRAVIWRLVDAGAHGSIVNIASVQGLRGHPQRIAYATSKHGVIGLTRALAADHAASGIRVNAICPGTIDTPMLQRELDKVPAETREATLQGYRELHPIGQIGRPDDVAYAALFLASDESPFITGIALPVDGGYTSLIVHQ